MAKQLSLHTAEPKKNQKENEATYKGYARVEFKPDDINVFPDCLEDKGDVLTHAAIGENGVIEKVVALKPPTLTRGPDNNGRTFGPQLHGPDLTGE